MAIRPETIAGRKAYFNRVRELINSQWLIDPEGTVHIPLVGGMEALIDSCDMELASKFLWRLKKHTKKSDKFYAESVIPEDIRPLFNFTSKHTSLHRVILNPPDGLHVDHANGDGLDCRRTNIRIATASQNTSNRRYKNSTGYRGVFKSGKKYGAQIEVNGKNKHLGVRSTSEEAALLYNEYALAAFGEFSILNEVTCAK